MATGTAYTHYASKDELVLAAYCETKAALAVAATAGLNHRAAAEERFHAMWLSCYRHLKANPEHGLFLLQVEHSPYRASAHEAALANENDLSGLAVRQPPVRDRGNRCSKERGRRWRRAAVGVEGDEVEFVRGGGVKVELDGYAGPAAARGVGEVFVAEHVELGDLDVGGRGSGPPAAL